MKNIITLEGYDEITSLFSKLKLEKEHWVKEKQIAAQQGDRSENAEYICAKANIRDIDKRLYRINWILNNTRAVNVKDRKKSDKILFGSTVKLLKDDTEELIVKIVGTHELIYIQKITDCLCISNISPLGKRLMRKEVDDDVDINSFNYEILEIK